MAGFKFGNFPQIYQFTKLKSFPLYGSSHGSEPARSEKYKVQEEAAYQTVFKCSGIEIMAKGATVHPRLSEPRLSEPRLSEPRLSDTSIIQMQIIHKPYPHLQKPRGSWQLRNLAKWCFPIVKAMQSAENVLIIKEKLMATDRSYTEC